MKHAVVLLSGGLDSATTLAVARADGFACHALSFSYGHCAATLDARPSLQSWMCGLLRGDVPGR